MKYLFIGGPRNGERLETDGKKEYRVMVLKPFKIEMSEDPFAFSPHETHTYNLFYLNSAGKAAVYVSESITPHMAIDLMVKHYNPKCTTSP